MKNRDETILSESLAGGGTITTITVAAIFNFRPTNRALRLAPTSAYRWKTSATSKSRKSDDDLQDMVCCVSHDCAASDDSSSGTLFISLF